MDLPYVRQATVVSCLALRTACGGGGGGGGGGGSPLPAILAHWYVDATAGSDVNAGTFAAPFKTIAHALAVVQVGQTIHAAPGVYDAANGETFPLVVPANVT